MNFVPILSILLKCFQELQVLLVCPPASISIVVRITTIGHVNVLTFLIVILTFVIIAHLECIFFVLLLGRDIEFAVPTFLRELLAHLPLNIRALVVFRVFFSLFITIIKLVHRNGPWVL